VKTRCACCILCLLLSGCAATTTQLPIGSQVRLRLYASAAEGNRITGQFVGASAESVAVRRDSTGEVLSVPRFRIESLDVRYHGSAQGIGAVLGAAAGGLGATAVVNAQARNCRREIGDACGILVGLHVLSAVLYYSMGIGGGFGLGYFLGSRIPLTTWQRVPLDRLRVAVTPLPEGRLGVGLAVGLR
jgi:hypothetical protein